MRKAILAAFALMFWQAAATAACGYVPTIELRNIAFNEIEGIYQKVTLYCPKAYLTVETNDETKQKGAWASDLLDEGNANNVCWLSGVPAAGNGQEKKLLSFSARYICKGKTPSQWGEVKIEKVHIEPNVKVCSNPVLSCPTLMGHGVTVAIGNEPVDGNPRKLRTCVCRVTH